MSLNGDATNNLTFTSGAATAAIGFAMTTICFGNSSTVTFTGTGNKLTGGDENFKVSGSTGTSTVSVGDGENTILMAGTGNSGDGLGRRQPDQRRRQQRHCQDPWPGRRERRSGNALDPDDAPVPLSPMDYRGYCRERTTASAATYENVHIDGVFVTCAATITLGDGNNVIVLRGIGATW